MVVRLVGAGRDRTGGDDGARSARRFRGGVSRRKSFRVLRWYPIFARNQPNKRYNGNDAASPITDPNVTLSRNSNKNTAAMTTTYTSHSRASLLQLTVLVESQPMTTLFHV